MKNNLIIIILLSNLAFFLACSSYKDKMEVQKGIYISDYGNFLERFFYKLFTNKQMSGSDTLALLENKQFIFNSSYNYVDYGSYRIEADNLILNIDSSYFNGDDTTYYETFQDTFRIENKNKLINEFDTKECIDDKPLKTIMELNYVDND